MQLAATGINLDYIAAGGLIFLFLVGSLASSRKKRLLESEISLEDVYKNAYKVKTKIEKLLNQR